MNHVQKIIVEIPFAGERTVDDRDVIGLFHDWIREKAWAGSWVDVADYTHVPGGPGLLLIGVEADYGVNRRALRYSRKFPLEGSLAERIRHAYRAALDGASRFERETGTPIRTGRARVLLNDRSTKASLDDLRPHLVEALADLFPEAEVEMERDHSTSRLSVNLVVRSRLLERDREPAAVAVE